MNCACCKSLLGFGRALWHMQEVSSSGASPQSGLEGLFPGCQDMDCLWSC